MEDVDRYLFNIIKEERKFNIFKVENKDEKNWILKLLFLYLYDSRCVYCICFFLNRYLILFVICYF